MLCGEKSPNEHRSHTPDVQRERAVVGQTAAGAEYRGLCDEDILDCQLALPEGQRRQTRIEALRRAISMSNQQGRQT
jgi:hypothetical protein